MSEQEWRYEGYHCCVKCDKEIPTVNLMYAHTCVPHGHEPIHPKCYHCGYVSPNSMFHATYEKVRKVDSKTGWPIKENEESNI